MNGFEIEINPLFYLALTKCVAYQRKSSLQDKFTLFLCRKCTSSDYSAGAYVYHGLCYEFDFEV